MKKVFYVFFAFFLLFSLAAEENLIKNGDFEKISGGKPEGWTENAWRSGSTVTRYSYGSEKPKSGKRYAIIENIENNDARLMQPIEVEPNTIYKLSCFIRAKTEDTTKIGATLSILDPSVNKISRAFNDTKGKWQQVEMFVRTGIAQKAMTVCLRLGAFGNDIKGIAEFDDLQVVKTKDPGAASIINLDGSSSDVAEGAFRVAKENELISSIIVFTLIIILILIAGSLLFFFVIKPRINPKEVPPVESVVEVTEPLYLRKQDKIRYTKQDFIVLGVLVLVYGIMAFVHLGTLKAPQTHWQPAMRDESFYVDLGSVQEIRRIYYFQGLPAGYTNGKYQVSYSNDAANWSSSMELDPSSIFYWYYKNVSFQARYIKVSAVVPNAQLKEIAFFGPNSQKPLEITQIFSTGESFRTIGSVRNVFDEQDTVFYRPTMYNGMPPGFDELYHARTAYEHLTKVNPYEISHPPLGKIIIGFGISLWGMNPFGWRFMGTTFGILIIVLMFLIGKQLFRKTEYAFMCAFLMAFDFMQYVQTRIATIDSYAVFFIILMYYFMYQYYKLDFYKTPFIKTLKPLMLCGLACGLGIATKWNAGMAIMGIGFLFFVVLFRRIMDYYYFKKKLKNKSFLKDSEERKQIEYYQKNFALHIWGTIGACAVFYVLIPLIIYILAYIPYMVLRPSEGLKVVWENQEYMYSYHSGMTATHPFSTRWYEWPIMWQPMWYHKGEGLLPNQAENLVAMGNPAVWWVGTLSALIVLVLGIINFIKRINDSWESKIGGSKIRQFFEKIDNLDRVRFFILVGFASQYLPWILSPRQLTFIYHFFGSVPFIILCTVFLIIDFKEGLQVRGGKLQKIGIGTIYVYLAIVLLLFIIFYPILSYTVVDKSYLKWLKWLPKWPIYY